MSETRPTEVTPHGQSRRGQTPEEEELAAKLAELASLEDELAQRELDLATLLAELHLFERRYLQIIGSRYAKLDDLKARIAEALAQEKPADPAAEAEARQARARAEESADAAGDLRQPEAEIKFQPSEDLKKLYREAARKVHPDLAVDEEDRKRRERLMKEVNQAYEQGDEAALSAVLRESEVSPEAITGQGVAFELVRAIRKIAQARSRLEAIDAEIAATNASPLCTLRAKAEESAATGRDLLVEMAASLDQEIAAAQDELERLVQETTRR
jgi:hypothetical protein